MTHPDLIAAHGLGVELDEPISEPQPLTGDADSLRFEANQLRRQLAHARTLLSRDDDEIFDMVVRAEVHAYYSRCAHLDCVEQLMQMRAENARLTAELASERDARRRMF